ncbi:TlpA family protein disulfide reductase [Pedobacter sp. HDW13]|uniref:TlpA family protein disulfide reductase n=1 Tax=Pedobacter sp. HDW13 TaxID=2714940 RepID=UPI001408009F|nr:TlpA disulfide reductase family protein [Pedobacter sp. HDW13]QIL40390.1 TlpA family protein disulfide reductase [Pedobacter sp. HDW13]
MKYLLIISLLFQSLLATAKQITFYGSFSGPQPLTEIKATLWDITEGYRDVGLGRVKKYELTFDEKGGFKVLLNAAKPGIYKLAYTVKGSPGAVDFFVMPDKDVHASFTVTNSTATLDLAKDINEETRVLYQVNTAVTPIIMRIYRENKNPDSVKMELGEIKELYAKAKAGYSGKSTFIKTYLDEAAFFQYTAILYDYPGLYKGRKKNKDNIWVMQPTYYNDGYDYKKYLNQDGVMLHLDAPLYWLDQYIAVNHAPVNVTDKAKVLDNYLQQAYQLVTNQQLRDAYSFYKLSSYLKATKGLIPTSETEQIIADNLHKIKDTAYTNVLSVSVQKSKRMLAGAEGFKFALENTGGKPVYLKDYAGKYLYVDVWATWCGPCKKERPFFDQLASRYQDKNIRFVGVSIDNVNQKQKWLDMVNADTNIAIDQLFAGSGSAFVNYYDITAIPRFLIFDPNGKLLQYDAPRPSNTAITALLDQLVGTK